MKRRLILSVVITLSLIGSLFVFSTGVFAASNYWIVYGGTGTGNWYDTNHWSLGHYPTASEPAVFDASSFNNTGQIVTIDNNSATCASMDWTNATNKPTINFSKNLTVAGNVTFISDANMICSGTGLLRISAAATLTTNGLTLTNEVLLLPGAGVTVQLGSALTTTYTGTSFYINSGIFNCNGYSLTCSGNLQPNNNTTLNMSGVTVTCRVWNTLQATGLTLTINGGSKLVVTAANTFSGGGYTYPEVDLNGAGTTYVTESNTFANLVLLSGVTQTIKFTHGTTQTVTNATLNGNATHQHTLTNETGTSTWAIAKAGGGTVTVSYCTITYSVASPATTWYYDATCTYNSTSGWTAYVPPAPVISNSASTYTLNSDNGGSGIVMPNTTYYSNPLGSTTSPTVGGVVDAECEWTLTNTSGMAIDLTVTMSDYSGGGSASTNSNAGTNGATSFGAKSYFSGQASGAWVVMKTAGSSVGYSNLAANTNIKWGFLELTQTNFGTSVTGSTSVIMITATAH